MREVLSLHIGQAGVQLSSAIWEIYCAEHHLQSDGILMANENDDFEVNDLKTFFSPCLNNQYTPRAITVDSEPGVLDEIRSGSYRDLFHPETLISGLEDASNNFARGNFTIGKNLVSRSMDQLRKVISNCDHLHGFIITSGYGGGTGSGFQTLLLENINIEYSKHLKISIAIYPSSTLSTSTVEPYNSTLTNFFNINSIDLCIPFDNESNYHICQDYLDIGHPTFSTINKLIAHMTSSMTVSLRHESSLNSDLNQIATNLVPFPRIHFPLLNAAPIVSEARSSHESLSAIEMTKILFDSKNQTVSVHIKDGSYFCCSLQYRGFITPREINESLLEIKKLHDVTFVDWCPTGFKVGLNCQPPVVIPSSGIAQSEMNATMLSNTSAIVQAFEIINWKFNLLFKKRAFIHWYVGEGMEEAEFTEAKDSLELLITDYREMETMTESKKNTSKPVEFQIQKAGNDSNIQLSLFENEKDLQLKVDQLKEGSSPVQDNGTNGNKINVIKEDNLKPIQNGIVESGNLETNEKGEDF